MPAGGQTQQTFSNFKEDFYEKVNDLSLFNCGDINLLKVVLDGLKVNYARKGKVRSSIFYSRLVYSIYLFMRRALVPGVDEHTFDKFVQENRARRILVHDIGRFIGTDDPKSICFENIMNKLPAEAVVCIFDAHHNPGQLTTGYIYKRFENLPLNKDEKVLRKQLIGTFVRIKRSKLFTAGELENIKFAMHKFFQDYKCWSRFLTHLNAVEKCYLICHYHKEGEILALKRNNVKVCELQHGLISEKDIFYALPPKTRDIVHKGLFADEILVFGEYWKKTLLKGEEYGEEKIRIIGNYFYEEQQKLNRELEEIINGKQVVLVTTQTFLDQEFIRFVRRLVENQEIFYKDCLILVKPHPYEDKGIYERAFANNSNVKVVYFPTSVLFNRIKTHVSVYSTTLYEALRYDVSNYIFEVPQCMDYTDEILKLGIADRIDIEKKQIDKYRFANNKAYFYDKYNSSALE